jgi:anti-sigma regulatory factor (Ser/Thr protein kinase)/GNAT superfamily N-acetyltransferase
MALPLKTTLYVPTDNRFLPLLQGSVRVLAEIGGLSTRDVLALELAAEEAFLNIREHAYADGTHGGVMLHGEIAAGELRLSFADEGIPFDPAALVKPGGQAEEELAAVPRLGFKLIHNAADEVRWINQGKQGKELRLVKRLPGGPGIKDAAPLPADIPKAPPQSYAVRPLQPDDAFFVSRMFWLAYGYTYRFEQFYRPEGLLEFVRSGQLVSQVVVSENGEVVGHAGMLLSPQAAVAEMVALAVSPAHRGRGLQVALTHALAAKAREMALIGVCFGAVTSHTISQREVAKFGAQPCALELATISPYGFKALNLEALPPQRESFLHCFKYLLEPRPALVHVPQRHRDIVARIYATLERPLRFGEPGQRGLAGSYAVSFNKTDNKGMILVKDADVRQWREILRATMDLADIAGADVVCLDLPLAQPETALLCEQAEQAGYFFAGICPHEAPDCGDLLRLTRLSAKIDFTRLQFFDPFALELANYVAAEMRRAQGGVLSQERPDGGVGNPADEEGPRLEE